MCGIMGYVGEAAEKGRATEVILSGLHALEYRGYDSAGLAVGMTDGDIYTVRCAGRVSELKARLDDLPQGALCGIGHTRWATHGAPTEANAHPHASRRLALVHNGIIENCAELRRELENDGYVFLSETDTECAAHLIDREYARLGHPAAAMYAALPLLRGSFALAVLFRDRPGEVWLVRRDSPLILALSSEGGLAASDIPAILPYSRDILRPEENVVFCLTGKGIYESDPAGALTRRETAHCDLAPGAADKGDYPCFMLKEMHEQPDAVRRVVARRIGADGLPSLAVDGIPDSLWREIDSIQIISCGSATHAGLVGRFYIEQLAGIPVVVTPASEYRYDPPAAIGRALALPISQSGETADTLAGLRLARRNGLTSVAIVNAEGSAIARESDHVMYTGAGPEIAVATTKGYATQVALLGVLAVKLALLRGRLDAPSARALCRELEVDAPAALASVLSCHDEIRAAADLIGDCSDVFFIGRGSDYPVGSECSLKLKEISYIHSDAYAAGELKHGTLALIQPGTPVVALASDPAYYDKMVGNIREVRARGGRILLVCGADFPDAAALADFVFRLPPVTRLTSPFSVVAFAQLLTYEVALRRGCDVDHPRNLAKSVTVE